MLNSYDSAIIDIDQLTHYLFPGEVVGTKWDNEMEEVIDRVSQSVSEYCGRKFATTTYTDELVDGNGSNTIFLRNWPIQSITSLYVDTNRKWSSGTQYTEDTSSVYGDFRYYSTEEGQGRVYLVGPDVFPVGPQCIKVTYVAGYNSIPETVQLAALRWAAHVWTVTQRGVHVAMSESVQPGGGSISVVEHRIPTDVQELLHPWRRISF